MIAVVDRVTDQIIVWCGTLSEARQWIADQVFRHGTDVRVRYIIETRPA